MMLALLGMQSTQPTPINLTRHISDKKTYSLDIPADWQVDHVQAAMGTVYLEPPVKAYNPVSAIGLLISVTKSEPKTTLAAYYKSNVASLKYWSRAFHLIEEKNFKAGTLDGKELVYSTKTDDGHRIQIVRFYIIDHTRVCELVTSADDLKQQQTLLETIATSFRFAR